MGRRCTPGVAGRAAPVGGPGRLLPCCLLLPCCACTAAPSRAASPPLHPPPAPACRRRRRWRSGRQGALPERAWRRRLRSRLCWRRWGRRLRPPAWCPSPKKLLRWAREAEGCCCLQCAAARFVRCTSAEPRPPLFLPHSSMQPVLPDAGAAAVPAAEPRIPAADPRMPAVEPPLLPQSAQPLVAEPAEAAAPAALPQAAPTAAAAAPKREQAEAAPHAVDTGRIATAPEVPPTPARAAERPAEIAAAAPAGRAAPPSQASAACDGSARGAAVLALHCQPLTSAASLLTLCQQQPRQPEKRGLFYKRNPFHKIKKASLGGGARSLGRVRRPASAAAAFQRCCCPALPATPSLCPPCSSWHPTHADAVPARAPPLGRGLSARSTADWPAAVEWAAPPRDRPARPAHRRRPPKHNSPHQEHPRLTNDLTPSAFDACPCP